MEATNRTIRYGNPEEQIKQYRNKIEVIKNSLKLAQEQKDEVLGFANSCIAEQITPRRVCKYMTHLELFAQKLNKPFKTASKEDLENLWNQILLESQGRWSPCTLNDFKVTIKKFYKTTEGDGEEYPRKVRFIKCSGVKPHLKTTPDELLQPDDIEKMIQSTNNLMWRAFISLLWDSGMRLYEQNSLRIKDVTITDSGVRVRCHGKTGSREYPLLVECYGYLNYVIVLSKLEMARSSGPIWAGSWGHNTKKVLKNY